jgi:hypothetical protein
LSSRIVVILMIDLSNKATLIYCEHVTAVPLSSQVVIT